MPNRSTPNRSEGPYVIAACVSCVNYGILIALSGYMGWTTHTWAQILQILPGHSWTWSASFIVLGGSGVAVVGNPRWPHIETAVCFAASIWLFIVGCFFVYSALHDGTPSNAALAWFVAFVFGYYGAGTLTRRKKEHHHADQGEKPGRWRRHQDRR